MNLFRFLTIGLPGAALLAASAVMADEVMYKWTDDAGTTYYAAQPPTDREYVEVDMTTGRLSFVEAPVYARPETEQSDAVDADPPGTEARADPRRMDPVTRANHCDELGERLRWLVAGRAEMLTDTYPEEQVRDVNRRGELIEQVAGEIDDHC